MTTSITTRRGLLRLGMSAAGAAAVTGGVAFASQASGAEPDRREWDQLCARFRDAQAEQGRMLRLECSRATEWSAIASTRSPKPTAPDSGPIDTSKSLASIIAATKTPDWKARWSIYERERAAWQTDHDAAETAFMGDVEARAEAAVEATNTLLFAIKAYPVPSLGMLIEKAGILEAGFGVLEGGDLEALLVDMRRLASREG